MGPVNTPRLLLPCPLPREPWPPCRFCLRPRKRRPRKFLPLDRESEAGGPPFSVLACGVDGSGVEKDESSPRFSGESDEKLLVSIVLLFSLKISNGPPSGNFAHDEKILNRAAVLASRSVMCSHWGNVTGFEYCIINLI